MDESEKILNLEKKVKTLEKKLSVKEKICEVLIKRVERSIDSTGGAFSVFERNILLQSLVDQRSAELEETNKRLAEQIAERITSEQRLYSIIQGSPTPLFVIGNDHRVIYWNKALEDLTGIRKKDATGTTKQWEAFYKEERPCLSDILLDGKIEEINYWYGNKASRSNVIDGAWEGTDFFPHLGSGGKWLHFTAAVIRSSEGKLLGAIDTVEDITEQRKMEDSAIKLSDRLRRAEKMEALGTLAGGVAHDLNNVLGIIVGYSELLLMSIPQDNPVRKYASRILESSEQSAAIIQDLLTLARRGVAVSNVVDLNQVISEFEASLEFEKIKKDYPEIVFAMDTDKNLIAIKGSRVHLIKTLTNLVSNAAESITNNTGRVTITTENRYIDFPFPGYDSISEGDYAVLTVTDNGKGISDDDIGRIFEPFYTKKMMGKSGTGLGLALVWGTVKDHDGYIDVKSKDGIGTTFTLYFPVTRNIITEGSKSASLKSYIGHGESILVVDDVEEQRELATTMLRKLSYNASAVPGGMEAVEYIRNNNVDLLILDMIMDPGIDGLETYKRIIEINPRQKAIIVSGYSETDRVKKAQAMGAGASVRKPYIMERLGIAVRHELDKK